MHRRAIKSLNRPKVPHLTRSGYVSPTNVGVLPGVGSSGNYMGRTNPMVDQLRRTIPIKFDLGSIITLIVVVCTMVWNFAHTNASVEETRQSIEQIRQANDSNRVSADVRMNGLETKIDRLYDKQGEANVSIGKVQSDIQNLRDRITFGQGEQQGEGAKRFPH